MKKIFSLILTGTLFFGGCLSTGMNVAAMELKKMENPLPDDLKDKEDIGIPKDPISENPTDPMNNNVNDNDVVVIEIPEQSQDIRSQQIDHIINDYNGIKGNPLAAESAHIRAILNERNDLHDLEKAMSSLRRFLQQDDSQQDLDMNSLGAKLTELQNVFESVKKSDEIGSGLKKAGTLSYIAGSSILFLVAIPALIINANYDSPQTNAVAHTMFGCTSLLWTTSVLCNALSRCILPVMGWYRSHLKIKEVQKVYDSTNLNSISPSLAYHIDWFFDDIILFR